MARLMPENLRSRSDVRDSIQAVVRLLGDNLPDDAIVTCVVGDDDPPLWILLPDAGIVGLYVIDAGRRSLQARVKEQLGRSAQIPELVVAAAREGAETLARMSDSAHLDREISATMAVAVPQVRRSDVAKAGAMEQPVLAREDLTPEGLYDALLRVLGGQGARLTEREERAVRAAIDPRIVIRDRKQEAVQSLSGIAFRAPGDEESPDLAVFDLKQQHLAFHLGAGYRVISGVAGSGKSLILTGRARHLSDQDPSARILVTCYNRIIAAALEEELDAVRNVDVHTVHAYAWRVFKATGRSEPQGDDKFEVYLRVAADYLKKRRVGAAFTYDAVLVDEAQDFDPLMLDVAFGALREPDADFVVARDGVQNIYRRSGKVWTANGTTAQGRTTVLTVNYRNTHEILDLAYMLLMKDGANDASREGAIQQDDDVVYPEATSRRGPPPDIVSVTSIDAEVRATCDQLEAWHRAGVGWGDILVLFGSLRFYEGKLRAECARRDIPYFCAVKPRKNRRLVTSAGDVVRSSTITAAKGIEFPYVAFMGVNQLAAGPEAEGVDHRRLAYVAMTRATDNLMITVSGQGPVGTDLLALGA